MGGDPRKNMVALASSPEQPKQETEMTSMESEINSSTMPEETESKIPEFPEPLENYPKPPNPYNRSHDFENVLAYMHQARRAAERGETLPPIGFGRYLGVNPQGCPQRYQSKLDERWDHFTTWLHTKWEGGVAKLPTWAQTGYNGIYSGMYWVGEKCTYALGVDAPRYQWVIDAHEQEQRELQREQEEEEQVAELLC